MRRSLVKYSHNPPAISGQVLIGIALIALIIYLLIKKNQGSITGQYSNKEEWDVQYNEDGLPIKISIHREATRA